MKEDKPKNHATAEAVDLHTIVSQFTCNDCKHCVTDEDDMPGKGFCMKLSTPSNKYAFFMELDFYCKYFDKKTG